VSGAEQGPDPDKYLPLKPRDFLILLALVEGEVHGYGILKEVGDETGGGVRLDPANLYRVLKRMMKDGLITESEKRAAPDLEEERRRYYGLTVLGASVVAAEAGRLRTLTDVAVARNLIPESRGQ
jgi:DNA-binding PadR family transcriptional regulator